MCRCPFKICISSSLWVQRKSIRMSLKNPSILVSYASCTILSSKKIPRALPPNLVIHAGARFLQAKRNSKSLNWQPTPYILPILFHSLLQIFTSSACNSQLICPSYLIYVMWRIYRSDEVFHLALYKKNHLSKIVCSFSLLHFFTGGDDACGDAHHDCFLHRLTVPVAKMAMTLEFTTSYQKESG